MKRLIDAEQAEKVLSEYYHHRTDTQHQALREALSKVPTAETDMSEYSDRLWKIAYERGKAEAVKRGMWTFIRLTNKDYGHKAKECSSCGSTFFDTKQWDYCPNCGARMDKDG